jgi:peptidoglycan hydrolase CwlO-like protein
LQNFCFQVEDLTIQASCLRTGISDLRSKTEADQETINALRADLKTCDENFAVARQNIKFVQEKLQKAQVVNDEVKQQFPVRKRCGAIILKFFPISF